MTDLSSPVPDTNVRWSDLILIGAAVLNMSVAADLMRHASPVGTTDYAEPEDSAQGFVCDFIRWCGHGADDGPEVERVRQYLRESGWRDLVIASAHEAAA